MIHFATAPSPVGVIVNVIFPSGDDTTWVGRVTPSMGAATVQSGEAVVANHPRDLPGLQGEGHRLGRPEATRAGSLQLASPPNSMNLVRQE